MSQYTSLPIAKALLDASTASITTAWQVVVSDASADSYAMEIFNSTGELLELGYGPGTASVTAHNYYIIPGGPDGRIGIRVDAGQNIFLRGVNITVATGIVAINFLR